MVKISQNYMIIETYKVDGDSIIDNTIIINKQKKILYMDIWKL